MVEDKISVKDSMVTNVITVEPSEVVTNAAQLMIKNDIGGLVVVDENKPVGIITEKDFTELIASEKDPHEIKIEEAMSKPLITISPDAGIIDAARLMTESHIRKLPVPKGDNLVGIITAEDILRVAPGEMELLLELASIKSQGAAGISREVTEGECELCGNYSESLYNIGGSYICRECRESQEK